MKRFFLCLMLMVFIGAASAGAVEVEIVDIPIDWDATYDEINEQYAYADPISNIVDDFAYVSVFFYDDEYGSWIGYMDYNFDEVEGGLKLSSVGVTYQPGDIDMSTFASAVLNSLIEKYEEPISTDGMFGHVFLADGLRIVYNPTEFDDGGGVVSVTYSPNTEAPTISAQEYTPTGAVLDFSVDGSSVCGIPWGSSQEAIFGILGEAVPVDYTDGNQSLQYAGQDSAGKDVEILLATTDDVLISVGYRVVLGENSAEYANILETATASADKVVVGARIGDWEFSYYTNENYYAYILNEPHFSATDNLLDETGRKTVSISVVPLDHSMLALLPSEIIECLQIIAETVEGYLNNSMTAEEAMERIHTVDERFPEIPDNAEYADYAYFAQIYVSNMQYNIQAVEDAYLSKAGLGDIVASMRARFNLQ